VAGAHFEAHVEPVKPESFSFKIILYNLVSRESGMLPLGWQTWAVTLMMLW
jgi:hypothetical protein